MCNSPTASMPTNAHAGDFPACPHLCSFLRISPDQPTPSAGEGPPTLARNNTRAQHLQKKGELQEGEEVGGFA